jgi:hypothetical protein
MPTEDLRSELRGLTPGLAAQDVKRIEGALASCWQKLRGSVEGGMEARKLCGRTEGMRWEPPTLTFDIDRHGVFVNGSTRVERQTWEIDTSRGMARIVGTPIAMRPWMPVWMSNHSLPNPSP